mmetsp:Transcript_27125/g.22390  ORF Transcript_27125/g.22390 Transcript_27125/m.22390 type:complete len:107 (+) Transcript_27125:368-688(+)
MAYKRWYTLMAVKSSLGRRENMVTLLFTSRSIRRGKDGKSNERIESRSRALGYGREYGNAVVHFKVDKKRQGLFTGIDGNATRVWMSHGDKVTQLPEGFEVVGWTA